MRYELLRIPFVPADDAYLAQLRELSDAGWQLRAIDHLFAYFQRPIPEESDETEAYRLLLAYATCEDQLFTPGPWGPKQSVLREHGYEGSGDPIGIRAWLATLNAKALKAARAVDRPHAPE